MKEMAKMTSGSGKWSSFFLAGEMFALRVEDVQEVLMHQPLTPVPLAPDYVLGLLNLRGHIMPAIDLRRLLRFPTRDDAGTKSVLLVLKVHDRLFSVVVDEIGDVLELPEPRWREAPDTLSAEHRQFVFGICPIEGHMVLGLIVDALGEEEKGRAA